MSSWSSAPYVNYTNLVLPNQGVNPLRNSQNFAQICGTIMSENPDIDISDVQVKVNDIVRQIYDRREWYGLMISGQIATTGFTTGGSVSITQGSNLVQGVGTNWTPAIVGQQFRLGYNTPPITVQAVDPFVQTLTLQLPWASNSYTSAGYFVALYYYSMGPTIKYIHTAKNMLMAWRLRLDYNQQTLDSRDPWRATVFTPTALVQMPPDQNGSYQVELWPVPSIVQALPFIAMIQPPNLVNDSDALPPAIRSDIVTKFGVSWAKTYKGPKWNKYYDKAQADTVRAEAERELMYMAKSDEDLYRQNIIFPSEDIRTAPDLLSGYRNAIWDFNHSVAAGEGNSEWSW
jgi:hypothetical protein